MVEATALKMAGSVLIIGASTLTGFFYSKKGRMREEQLLEMKRALTILKSEIRFQLAPLGEAFAAVCERVKTPASEIFAYSSKYALSGKDGDAAVLWERAIDKVKGETFYTAEDIRNFKAMGKSLGCLDKEMQGESIDLLIEYIDGAVSAIREKDGKESRMCKSLGFLSGLLVTVVLM